MPLHWQHIPSLSHILSTTPPYTRLLASLVMLEAPRRTPISTEEIVDDSEPERAEIRRRERKARSKLPTTARSSQNKPETAQRTVTDITPNNVIEISDSDSESKRRRRNIDMDLQSRKKRTAPSTTASGSSLMAVTESTTIPSLSKRSIENTPIDSIGKLPRVLDPKLFAYVSSTAGKKPSLRTVLPSTHARKNSALLAFAPQKPPTFDISNEELSKVSRCVCCEISWTVRKTGPQKLAHIRSCANKHNLNEETVLILLKKEVAGYVGPPQALGKNRPKESLPQAGPSSKKTFLEEVVDAAPRKKTKRWQAETVLANVSTTRDSILARAQGILNASFSSAPDSPEEDNFMDQPFRPSALLSTLDRDAPSTQPFARSTLAHIQGTSKTSLFNMNTSPIRLIPTNVEIPHRYVHTASSAPAGGSPSQFKPIIPGRLLKEVWEIGHEGQPDMIFRKSRISLDLNNNKVTLGTNDSGSIPEIVSLNSRPPSSCCSLHESFSNLNVESTPRKTPQKSIRIAKPRSPKLTIDKKAVDFGAEWEAHMKLHIMKDVDLHQRILRYEPIHFDIFLELAKLYAPLTGKLKLQVQKFLDQQAILTYGKSFLSKD